MVAHKKPEVMVKEYVHRLSDDDLRFIVQKLSTRLGGDKGDAAAVFQKDREIDRWLSSAISGQDWFDMVNRIEEAALFEINRRDRG